MKLCIRHRKSLVEKYQLDILKEFILQLQKNLPLNGNVDINFLDKQEGKMTTGSLTNEGYFNGELSGSRIDVDNGGELLINPLLTQEYIVSIPSLQSLSVITKKSSSATLPNNLYPAGCANLLTVS